MPSFAYEVRSELVNVANYNRCCNIAQLNAMLKVGAEVNEAGNRIDFSSTNAAISRKVLILLKRVYKDVKTEVAVVRNKKFRSFHRYVIRIFLPPKTNTHPLLKAMQSFKFPDDTCCENAYLRGLFLTSGSVNRPEARYYHLEISASSPQTAKFIQKNMIKMGFPVGLFKRLDKYVVYMKSFDTICEFLYMIKADKAEERYEIARNLKDVRANVNRVINCETSNLQKAVNAAQKQIKDIKTAYEMGLPLREDLKQAAEARMENPEMAMGELAKKLFISTASFKIKMKEIHLLVNPPPPKEEEPEKPKKKRGRKPKNLALEKILQ